MDNIIKFIQIIFPVVGTIVVALIESKASKERKATEEHAKTREREARLSMKMIDATMLLSEVTANAVMGGHNNGNVETARAAVTEARSEYQAFLQEIAAKEITQ